MPRSAIMLSVLVCLLSTALAVSVAQASESQWVVSLTLEGAVEGMSDSTTRFGVKGEAQDGHDPTQDVPNPAPPPSGDYVDLYFYRPTWPGQTDWAQDWRSAIPLGGTATWEDMRAHSTVAGTDVLAWSWGMSQTLSWDPPAYYAFTLYDEGDAPNPTGGTPYDMRAQSDMTFLTAGGGALRYFHITVTDTRAPSSIAMSQPEYTSTYGETSQVQATLVGGELPLLLFCLPGVRFEWDLDGDGDYDDLTADGVDNDCDGTYDADVLLDACAGTYSVRAVFDGDDVYQPSVSPPSVNSHHKGWIEILGEGALPMEEVPFTYSDPGSVTIVARDASGNPLLHPDALPEIRMDIYEQIEWMYDKASPTLALVCSETCSTQTSIDLEIQEAGEVDLVPGEYYVVFSWPGDCHYHAAITDATLVVEPETVVSESVMDYPRLSPESTYCEEVTVAVYLRDDDGEELCHLLEDAIIVSYSVHDPVSLGWDLVCTKEMDAASPLLFTYAAEDLWNEQAARAAADSSLQYELAYYGSPYYEPSQDAGSWTVNAFDKSSPMLYSGWNMVGVAGYPVDPDPASVFGGIAIDGLLYRWDPGLTAYIAYMVIDSGPFGDVQPGDGYWLYLDSPTSFTYPGYCTSGKRVHCPLAGWYLIGNPLGDAVPTEDISLNYGGQDLPFAEAVAAGWVSSPLYMWDPSLGGYVTIGLDPWDLGYLPAFAGAWIKVEVDAAYIKFAD